MWKFFSIDGPIVNGIDRWTSLVWLNILTTFCCVPIITAGASLTAMHCVVFRISKGEELAVTKVFSCVQGQLQRVNIDLGCVFCSAWLAGLRMRDHLNQRLEVTNNHMGVFWYFGYHDASVGQLDIHSAIPVRQ